MSIDATLDGFERISANYIWPVHIPADGSAMGTTFSLHLSDPGHAGGEVQMACADLLLDRDMDGLTYSISEGLVADGNVPSVAEVSVVRHELGHTDFVVEISNLRPGFTLPASVHELPCVAQSPLPTIHYESSEQATACAGRDGTEPDCTATASNTLNLPLVTGNDGIASVLVRFPFLVDAGVQSIKIFDCLDNDSNADNTGECAGGGDLLMCIDLLDDIPHDDSTFVTTGMPSTSAEYFTTPEATAAVETSLAEASTTTSPQKEGKEASTVDSTTFPITTDATTKPATTTPDATTPDASTTAPGERKTAIPATTDSTVHTTHHVTPAAKTTTAKEAKIEDTTTAAANRAPGASKKGKSMKEGKGKKSKGTKEGKGKKSKGKKGAVILNSNSWSISLGKAGKASKKSKSARHRERRGFMDRSDFVAASEAAQQTATAEAAALDARSLRRARVDQQEEEEEEEEAAAAAEAESKIDGTVHIVVNNNAGPGGSSKKGKKPKHGHEGGSLLLNGLEVTNAEANLYCFPASASSAVVFFKQAKSAISSSSNENGEHMSGITYQMLAGAMMAFIGTVGIILQVTSTRKSNRNSSAAQNGGDGYYGSLDTADAYGYQLPSGEDDTDNASYNHGKMLSMSLASSAVFDALPQDLEDLDLEEESGLDEATTDNSNMYTQRGTTASLFWRTGANQRTVSSPCSGSAYPSEIEKTAEPAERAPLFSQAHHGQDRASTAVFDACNDVDFDDSEEEFDPR